MVTSVSVLGLVVDDGTVNFDTAGGEVSLEVGAVILRIPQTPLCKGEELKCLRGRPFVRENDLLDFSVISVRYEESNLSLQVVLLTCDDRISHTMAALIGIKFSLDR